MLTHALPITWGILAHVLLLTWGVLARPFLPAGRGGLILIAGGLSMTAFAMLMLVARNNPRPAESYPPRRPAATSARATSIVRAIDPERRPPAPRPQPSAEPVQVRTQPVSGPASHDRLVWPDYVQSAAARNGLRNTQVLSVDRTRCLIEVRACLSCRRGRKACDRERKRLRQAARKLSRRARVTEIKCNDGRRHVCTFRIDMGAQR